MRDINRKLHRWLGLALGLFLTFQGLTGVFLHYGGDLDRWLNPQLDPPGYRPQSPRFDAAIEAARNTAPENNVIFVDAPRPERNTYRVVLDDALGDRLYLHPETLDLLLRRGAFAEPVDVVEALHTGALAGEWLGIVLGMIGLLTLPLLITGLLRWWPGVGLGRLRRGLRIHWRTTLQWFYTSHRTLGVLGIVVLLFIVATGTALSLHDWMHPLISRMTGDPPRPERPRAGEGMLTTGLSIDSLAQRARLTAGGASPTFVILPRRPGDPVVFRLRHADEWHPSGRSEVYFHPRTGERIGRYVVDQRNGTQKVLDSFYPLHIAAPFGELGRVVAAIAGVLLAYFSVSGVVIWWYRGRRTRSHDQSP